MTPDLAHYRAELNERLIVHFSGGAWRVPLGERHLDVELGAGTRLGRIVCGDAADARRAFAGLAPGAGVSRAALAAAIAPYAALLTEVLELEGASGSDGLCAALPQSASGAVLLLTPAGLPLERLLDLISGLVPRGLVWKPAPGAAASAHLIARAITPLTAAQLAFVQGDHASGQALAACVKKPGALIWAGAGRPPKELSRLLPG